MNPRLILPSWAPLELAREATMTGVDLPTLAGPMRRRFAAVRRIADTMEINNSPS